jgi:hypothetical protein
VRCTPLLDKTDGGIFADRDYGACTGPVTVEVGEATPQDDTGHRTEADENASYAPPPPPGDNGVLVPVNTQTTLAKVVGKGFTEWEYPTGLLPETFSGLEYVSGPNDLVLGSKGSWRKPVTLKHGPSGAEVLVNCYRRREEPTEPPDPNLPGTPFVPPEEPDHRYESAEFHDLKAAVAREKSRGVFVFLDGGILFKVEVSGGSSEQRQKLVRSTAEAIWEFRHREDTASECDDSSTRDSKGSPNSNGAVPGIGKAGGGPRP